MYRRLKPGPGPRHQGPWAALAASLALALALALPAGRAEAQASPGPRPLSAKERSALLRLAHEPLAALAEGRPPKELQVPASMPRLGQARRMVLSLYLDGQLLARAWELRSPGALSAAAPILAQKAMTSPDAGRPPTFEELPRVKVGIAVIHDLREVASDKEAKSGEAAIALIGFSFAVGLPSDLAAGGAPFQLYSKACEISGLRPGAWLADGAALFAGTAEELAES